MKCIAMSRKTLYNEADKLLLKKLDFVLLPFFPPLRESQRTEALMTPALKYLRWLLETEIVGGKTESGSEVQNEQSTRENRQ